MHKILATHILKSAEQILILSHYSDKDSDYHEITSVDIMHCHNSFSHVGWTSWLKTFHGFEYATKEFNRYVLNDRTHG